MCIIYKINIVFIIKVVKLILFKIISDKKVKMDKIDYLVFIENDYINNFMSIIKNIVVMVKFSNMVFFLLIILFNVIKYESLYIVKFYYNLVRCKGLKLW